VLALTREVAVEFARQGVRANALCPGPIDTPMLAELLSDPDRRQRRIVHIPVGRPGRAEEIALRVVPCIRGVVVHHGVHLRGGRRHHRRVHDAGVIDTC